MHQDDDGFDQRDPLIQKLFDVSDDLAERSARAIRRSDEASRSISRILSDASVDAQEGLPPMEWAITHEKTPGLTVVRGRGSFRVSGCWLKVADVAAEKDPLCPVMFDGRGLEVNPPSFSNLIELESILRHHITSFLFCKIGILVPDGAVRDLAEQWSRLASAGNPFRIAVFTDEPAARGWLAES